jgi:hypothetical protein
MIELRSSRLPTVTKLLSRVPDHPFAHLLLCRCRLLLVRKARGINVGGIIHA